MYIVFIFHSILQLVISSLFIFYLINIFQFIL